MLDKNMIGVGAKEAQRGRLPAEKDSTDSNTGAHASKAQASAELVGIKIIRADGTEEIIK